MFHIHGDRLIKHKVNALMEYCGQYSKTLEVFKNNTLYYVTSKLTSVVKLIILFKKIAADSSNFSLLVN